MDDVSLTIEPGELIAIAGQNGAGKTTLMRVAAGELEPDGGSVRPGGTVALVHQHFMLVPALTVAENLALMTRRRGGLRSGRKLDRDAEALIARTGIALGGVARPVADLSVGEKAKLELIKAVARDPAVLILDEPTAVLTPTETAELFSVMRALAARGTAVVFISHKLPEVLTVARRIVVMRDGRIVADTISGRMSPGEIATAMTPEIDLGATVRKPTRSKSAPTVLERDGLTLRQGEIAAVVGVAGNGQTELAHSLRRFLSSFRSGHIPEDRTRDGIIAEMTIAENLGLRQAKWSPRAAARHASRMIELYSIRARGPLQLAGELSGGNQQKLVLARELDPRPAVIVAAEPTRGLDLVSTRFIHQQLVSAAAAGAAILLITSDLDEAFALADSIQVINRGRLSEAMTPQQASARVAPLMAGLE